MCSWPKYLTSNLEPGGLQGVLELALDGGSVADVHGSAGFDYRVVAGEGAPKETLKLFRRHLIAPNFQLLLRVAFVVDVVWRISEHQIGLLTGHQPPHSVQVRRIAAEYAVLVFAQ
jgi:hypothetical protein